MKIKKKTSKIVKKIEKHFLSHDINVKLKLKTMVPELERYIFRVKLNPGTKANAIFDRAHDIKLALRIPLFEPFQDDNGDICIAVSEKANTENSFLDMITSKVFRESDTPLLFALGYDLKGDMIFCNLAELPHLLYGGSSNYGKSFGLISLCLSLAVRNTPDELSIIIIDTGARTMNVFRELKHLSYPIVKDVETGVYVIRSLVNEMERRQGLNDEELKDQPKIVCIIDELASFVMNAGNKNCSQQLVHDISDLLQRCRHNGIYMVLSTQNSTNEDTGIKFYNITARVAFACANQQHSRNVLGEVGAEKLTDKGAMLFKSRTFQHTIRLQGAFMELNEVEKIVERIKYKTSNISNRFVIPEKNDIETSDKISEYLNDILLKDEEKEKELADIIVWTLSKHEISASEIKAKYRMGNRASTIIESLCEWKIIADKFANQKRKVIVNSLPELSDDVTNFVGKYGYTTEHISDIFAHKSQSASSGNQLTEAVSQNTPKNEGSCEDNGELE